VVNGVECSVALWWAIGRRLERGSNKNKVVQALQSCTVKGQKWVMKVGDGNLEAARFRAANEKKLTKMWRLHEMLHLLF
jgi:hypothetical protein